MEASSQNAGSSTAWRSETFVRAGRVWVLFSCVLVAQSILNARADPLHTWWTVLALLAAGVAMVLSVFVTGLPHAPRVVLLIAGQAAIALVTVARGGSWLTVGALCFVAVVFAATSLSSARNAWSAWGLLLVLLIGVLSWRQVAFPPPVEIPGEFARQWRAMALYAVASATMLHALRQIVSRYEESLTRLEEEGRLRVALLRQLETVEDAQRLRLSHELHDDVAQRLAALKIELDLKGLSAAPVPAEALRPLGAQLGEALSSVRALAKGLRPVLLDELGLVEAARELCRAECDRAGVEWALEAAPGRLSLPKETEVAAFRFLQEGLSNALRHGRPRRVRLLIGVEGKVLSLAVEDDGAGFDVALASREALRSGHLGLLGMRERIRAVGGAITVDSRPGRTVISARIQGSSS